MKGESRIAKLVRKHVATVLADDLKGGEHVMKEVWEACDYEAEMKEAEKELRRIIAWLRGPR